MKYFCEVVGMMEVLPEGWHSHVVTLVTFGAQTTLPLKPSCPLAYPAL